jgi:uncharacterized protein DUF6879
MTRRIDTLGEEFAELFRNFDHTAFRLETLQKYAVDYEEEPMRRFLAGEPQPADPAKDEWCQFIRDARANGKEVGRVHIVVEPLSEYMRYELAWSYGGNVDAGEDIRIAPVRIGSWVNELPRDHDFWLFDSRDLWIMSYDEKGRFLAAEQMDDPAEVVRHNYWRDVAKHVAVGFHEYMRHHPELRLANAS